MEKITIEVEKIGSISDGYHTFDELYEHRIVLFIALCKALLPCGTGSKPWRTKVHSDGSSWAGWFILGLNKEPGRQITYHLPIEKWDSCSFAQTLEKAPDFDGHSPNDVLERLKTLVI